MNASFPNSDANDVDQESLGPPESASDYSLERGPKPEGSLTQPESAKDPDTPAASTGPPQQNDSSPWTPSAQDVAIEAQETDGAPAATDEVADARHTLQTTEKAPAHSEIPSVSAPVPSELLSQLNQGLAELRESFEEKIKYDASREAIIDRLHAEIQEYRADLMLKMAKPFATGLINLYDDVGKTVEAYKAKNNAEDSVHSLFMDLLESLHAFQEDIEDLLDRNGFESFTVSGDAPDVQTHFDPKQQRVADKVATSNPDLNRVVAESVRKGFRYDDRVVRPEMVAVYIYKEP